MHPEFATRGDPLGRFIEECGEALAAAGKIVRFGWESSNPLPGQNTETNEEWLNREISDLEDAIANLRKAWGQETISLPKEYNENSRDAKTRKGHRCEGTCTAEEN